MPLEKHSGGKKEKQPEYQYNQAKYHPVEEFLVTITEKLTSDTPSFVLEVTWPRVALFYHPVSPLCIQLRDRYVAIAREIRRRSIRAPVEFWAVNCEVHRDACEDLGINAVPRLLGFPQGSIEGKLIQRTMNNDIEVQEVIDVLDVNLKIVDEAEETEKQRKKEEDKLKMKEYQLKNLNDPQKMHIGESDHMQEILHPHSELSDVYSDAMESFFQSIHSTVEKDSNGDVIPWSSDRLQILHEWLDLMHWTLPTRDMAHLHNVINDMRNNFKSIEDSPKEVTRILKSHDYYKHKRKWSTACSANKPEDDGFGCGFWKLLHIMSIGVAEQHASVMGDLDRIFIGHIMKVVRDYVEEIGFAENEKAGDEVIMAYSDCQENERCRKEMGLEQNGVLARFRKQLPIATDPSWQNLSIWLWRVHQSYRTQLLSQTEKGYDSLLDSEDIQWPPAALCPKCYASGDIVDPGDHETVPSNPVVVRDPVNEITWNKENVYNHLRHEYWPKSLQSPRVVVIARLKHTKGLASLSDHLRNSNLFILSLILLVMAICMVFNFGKVRRRLSRFSGRHKKLESHFEDYGGNDDNDDYWMELSRATPSAEDQPFVHARRRIRNASHKPRFTRPPLAFLDD